MKNFMIKLSSKNIDKFLINSSAYETGTVVIQFRNTSQEELLTTQQKLKEKLIGIPILKLATFLIILDIENAQSVYDILNDLNYLTNDDRSNIAALLQKISNEVNQRSKLTHTITKAHDTLILSVDELYIDDILDQCDNYVQAVLLLRIVFSKDIFVEKKLVIAYLRDDNLPENLCESMITLWRIVNGKANLETTLSNMGSLPANLSQRFVVHDHCMEKLSKKYNNLDDENQLYMYLGLLMFRKPNGHNLIVYNKDSFYDIIRLALAGNQESLKFFDPDLMVLITTAFAKMGILSQDNNPDITRIRKLAKLFHSNILDKYSDQLDAMLNPNKNSLLEALKNDSPKEIEQAIIGGADINQHFPNDGRTPTIYAVQECSDATLAEILKHDPDIEAFNSYKKFKALFGAIKSKQTNKVGMLLEKGANVHEPCGILIAQQAFFQSNQQFYSGTPLQAALDEYSKNRDDNHVKAIISMLLNYGAAIGVDFTNLNTGFFDQNILAIGAILPENVKWKPITNVDEFIARISVDKYPHYQRVLQQVPNHVSQSENVMMTYQKITVHINIVESIKKLILTYPKYKTFKDAIDKQDYTLALRRACTCENKKHAITFATLVLNQKAFPIDINGVSPSNNKNAYDYAKEKDNEGLCELLRQNNATPTSKLVL